MSIEKQTKRTTEADLEGRIDAVMQRAFPWLKPDDLLHQTRFQFKFGNSVVVVNGKEADQVSGRADVLISQGETPLAVLELKRPGNTLNADDESQGLSYARMLNPFPPLVVVSNGEDMRIFSTYTGQAWEPETRSESELNLLLKAVGKIAAEDMKKAVEVLLGPNSTIWGTALRAATNNVLAELKGGWDNTTLPFVSDFLVSREATENVLENIQKGKQLIIVEGAPLIGKSNILRDLVERTADSDDMVIFFIEADGGGGSGILQDIANILNDELGWSINAEEARTWLRHHSRSDGPVLVLAIDGVGPTRNELRRDIEELTGNAFGSKLCLVLAIDDTLTESLVLNNTGRKTTRIGRRASIVTVKLLNDSEFDNAMKALYEHRITIMHGGNKSSELRNPWVLRALAANVVSSVNYADMGLIAELPPLLGPNLIQQARHSFRTQLDILRWFQEIAKAVIIDSNDHSRAISLKLESMNTFMVRRKTFCRYIKNAELKKMVKQGLVKPGIKAPNEHVVIVRLPELLASEIARFLASKLRKKLSSNSKLAANWLISQTSKLPLGDVIGAQALFDAAYEQGSLPLDLIENLLKMQPKRKSINPGTHATVHFPDAGAVKLEFAEDGKIIVRRGNTDYVMEFNKEDASPYYYDNMQSWMILSHVASHQILAESPDGSVVGRVDAAILLEVGACSIVLLQPNSKIDYCAVRTHDLPGYGSIVCHYDGIVEPITLSIFRFLERDAVSATVWIEDAVKHNSFPLLARIDISLRQIASRDGDSEKNWAREMLEKVIRPAFGRFPSLH